MLTYSFVEKGSDSLYEHLYKCLKNDIVRGILVPGERLPSKRSFAKNLGISIITVENAYFQLMAEGYIYSLPKKGYYVSDVAVDIERGNTTLSYESMELSSGKSNIRADFTSNQTEPDIFPFSVWSRLMREELSDNREALMTNPPSGGVIRLREAIAEHLKEFQGIHVMPEQIIVGAGTEYLCGLLVQLLGFDKTYAMEEPGYGKIHKIYKSHGIDCRKVPMDECGVSVSRLNEEDVDVLHISPAHNYPTGRVMPIGRRYEVLGWAAQSESRYIIEDSYDSEFRLKGKPVATMQSIDVAEKIIYMNTFTKTISSTIRISYMVLPPHLVDKFYSKMSFYACTVSNFEQYTLAKFIQEGYFEKRINRMRRYYLGKKNAIIDMIKSGKLNKRCEILEEDAGLHFLLKIKTEKSAEDIKKAALRQGVRISSLDEYYENPPKEAKNTFIINYSFVSESELKRAMKKLEEIL